MNIPFRDEHREGSAMGRKLSAFEAASTSFSDGEADAGQDPIIPTRSQILLQRIAQQLGISPDEFRKVPARSNVAQSQGTPSAAFDPALSRECLDLIDAYTRITDAEQRLRCLQAVQDAAALSVSSDPGALRR